MARKSKDHVMFNPELKERFILYMKASYKAKLLALFRKSYRFETKINKDIFQFNKKEIEELFAHLNLSSVTDTYNCLKYYLDYCVKEKFTNVNEIVSVDPHYFEDFITPSQYRISEDELEGFISKCINVQDKLILRLLFEGVYGKGRSELFNLKKWDINWKTNTLNLYCDSGKTRPLELTDQCMELIRSSLDIKECYRENGTIQDYYCENDFIIRSVKRFRVSDETKRAGMPFLISRFKHFKKHFKSPAITSTVVNKSGMLRYAIQISKMEGIHIRKLSHIHHWSKVAERYPMTLEDVNGVPQYTAVFRIDFNEVDRLYGDYLANNYKLVDETNTSKASILLNKRKSAMKFKAMMVEAYEGTCAITNDKTIEILEACHIQKFINEESNHYQNGILLRVDIHRLYDKGLIIIDEDYKIHVSNNVSEYYRKFHGLKINLPKNRYWYPSKEALNHHIKTFEIRVNN